ncbi:MAG TPA: acetyltransferase [Candidatus Limnocylindrales bacterium]|nr:acetyltransferase [Candidatus Limnocylindrales bacterium]
MTDKVVLFGNGQVASLAHYYLTHDSDYEVVAFTVDASHVTEPTLRGLPVVPVEQVTDRFPPDEYRMFVTVGYGRVNKFREEKYHQVRDLGYRLISYVSTRATVWPDVEVGDNCFIMENNIVQPFVRLGSDITMWSGCHIGHESVIGDHCFLSSHTVVSGNVVVEANCFLGVNSTIRDGITIARDCVIGAGSVINASTTEKGIYVPPRAEKLALTSDRLPRI